MKQKGHTESPRIYNLFPLLAGPMPGWKPHLQRARQMGFNWVFLNPFHLPGASGSIYSIQDQYAYNPLLVDPKAGPPEKQLRQVLQDSHGLGMKMMMDLVINHTAVDSPLVAAHPLWYRRGSQGELVHPGAYDNGRWVSWNDLAAVDNASSPERESLWQYWLQWVSHSAALGFDGFRCDAAYQVPAELWRFLIEATRKRYPAAQFFAETLGCPPEQTLETARTGFDFILNSSKWWDFSAPWCLEQYRLTAPVVPSISFPESHDTERLAAELNGDRAAVRQRYVFATLFSTGVMVPIGFEYGFRRRLHVVHTRPEHWEAASWDDTEFIRQVNAFKAEHRIWNEEGPMESLDIGNLNVLALYKNTRDGSQRSLLLFNKDRRQQQSCIPSNLRALLGNSVLELSTELRLQPVRSHGTTALPPAGFQIFLSIP